MSVVFVITTSAAAPTRFRALPYSIVPGLLGRVNERKEIMDIGARSPLTDTYVNVCNAHGVFKRGDRGKILKNISFFVLFIYFFNFCYVVR